METEGWLAGYTDPKVRSRLCDFGPASPRTGLEEALAFAQLRAEQPRLMEQAEADPYSAVGWAALGALHGAERSRTLDLLGFDAQLVFSTFAISQFLASDDPEVRSEGTRGHNRGVVDFCSADARLLPVGIVPLDDPETAVELLKHALTIGCAAIWIPPASPRSLSPSHEGFEPFWSRLEDADTPFVLHVGTGGGQIASVYNNTGRPQPRDYLGGGDNMRAKDFMVLHHLPETILSVLIVDGVLDRHPRLRGACIENGSSWIESWMHRLDMAPTMFSETERDLAALTLRPSEYVHRQLKFTTFEGDPVHSIIDRLGANLLMFSSDYPHPEGGRDPIGRTEKALAGMSEETIERHFSENFAELMGSRLPTANKSAG